mmetsp:Transcript_82182/g.227986  ORF Transcript_82182/g.227986 Transcript_82182/m.227986 type:complete len:228 (-) Transcript_82182:572-1255(-)
MGSAKYGPRASRNCLAPSSPSAKPCSCRTSLQASRASLRTSGRRPDSLSLPSHRSSCMGPPTAVESRALPPSFNNWRLTFSLKRLALNTPASSTSSVAARALAILTDRCSDAAAGLPLLRRPPSICKHAGVDLQALQDLARVVKPLTTPGRLLVLAPGPAAPHEDARRARRGVPGLTAGVGPSASANSPTTALLMETARAFTAGSLLLNSSRAVTNSFTPSSVASNA